VVGFLWTKLEGNALKSMIFGDLGGLGVSRVDKRLSKAVNKWMSCGFGLVDR